MTQMMTEMRPMYSICICNYNMADTIEVSLKSILDQLDDRFEVVVVDDGSTDHSVSVLVGLAEKYKKLRVVPLQRDKNRRLGLTRNESIRAAQGTYVMLHLDCDDVYGPYLKDFVEAFHQVEAAFGRDILLSGQHINMGRRSFLLEHGPYRNIFRGEDRDLWERLSTIDAYVPFNHVNFVERLTKTRRKSYMRAIFYTYDHLLNYFRSGAGLGQFFYYEVKKWPIMSLKLIIYRLLCVWPAYVMSFFEEPLPPAPGMGSVEKFAAYRDRMRGTLTQILARFGHVPDWNKITPEGSHVFGDIL